MKIAFKVEGDVRAIYGSSAKQGKRAVTTAVGAAGAALKARWRGQIIAAGLGAKLGNSVRSKVYPSGGVTSFHAAALVWTKAGNIIDSFETGVVIRSASGFFLAIPLPAAGQKGAGGKKITPGGWEQRTGRRLRFVYRANNYSLLVADEGRLNKRGLAVKSQSKTGRGVATVPIFLLMRQVRLPKKLNLMAAGEQAIARLPESIVATWRDD